MLVVAAVTSDLTSVTGVVVEMLCRRVNVVAAAAAAEAAAALLSVVVVRVVVPVVVSDTAASVESPFSAFVLALPSVLQLL